MGRCRSLPAVRRLSVVLAVCLAFLQVIPPAFAAQFSVFKKTYTRQSGSPVTETDTFPILNPAGTSWTLRAVNGDLEDTSVEKVSSATLSLNGAELLRPHQFNQNVSLIEEPVVLQSSNTIATQLRGQPGGRLTIEITGEDPTPPLITWINPPSDSVLTVSTVQATLRLTDDLAGLKPESLLIRLDGEPTTAFGSLAAPTLEATLTATLDLADGTHTLSAEVSDLANQHAVGSVRFTIQTIVTPPVNPQSGFIHGSIFHALTQQPMADAVVTVRGLTGEVRTDAEGQFQFPTPNTGEFLLDVAKPGFTSVQRAAQVLATRDVAVEPAYLTPLDPQMTPISRAAGGLATDSGGMVEVEFPSDAAPQDLHVRITPLRDERQLPGPMTPGTAHVDAVYFEPRFTTFDKPVIYRHRNTMHFAPGMEIQLAQWNDQTRVWMDAGVGHVTPDGEWVEFPIVRFFCWYCLRISKTLPPQAENPDLEDVTDRAPPSNDPGKACPQTVGSAVCPESGDLSITHTLPSVRTLGQPRSLAFTYRSGLASPSVLLGTDYLLDPVSKPGDPGTLVPLTTSAIIQVEGRRIQAGFTGTAGATRQTFLWDARNARGQLVPTGAYAYTVDLSNDYQATYGATGVPVGEISRLTTRVAGRAIVRNERASPFGAGWGLNGLQRVLPQPDDTVLMTDGDGSATVFRPGPMPDLVVASLVAGDVSVLLGHGDGTFQPRQRIVPGRLTSSNEAPVEVAAADFNDDGWQDLAVILSQTQEVAIQLGRGGAFRLAQIASLGGNPKALAVGDVNGDDIQDLAAANQNSNDVSVLLGNGDGTFQPQRRVPVGTAPSAITIGDLNGDGRLDLMTVNQGSNDVSVLLGVGDGAFQTQQRVAVGPNPKAVVLGDLNGDVVLDAVVTVPGNVVVSVLLGRGDGTFLPKPNVFAKPANSSDIAAGDMNGDGALDLVMVNNPGTTLSILLGDGSGGLAMAKPVAMSNVPVHVAIADFNRDGRSDVAVSQGLAGASVLLGKGDGTFEEERQMTVGSFPLGIAVGEFDDVLNNPAQPYGGLPGDFSRLDRRPDGTFLRRWPNGTESRFDNRGFLQETADRNGNATTYAYDPQDKLARVAFPGGAAVDLAYDAAGRLASLTDSAGRVTRWVVDGVGDLRRLDNPDGATRRFAYDEEHRLTAQTNERGFTTDYVYDGFGRIREVALPERSILDPATMTESLQREVRRFSPSDTRGLINSLPPGTGSEENPAPPVPPPLATFQDGRGVTIQLATDPFGAPTKIVDGLGRTTTIDRDVNGTPVKIIRPNGSERAMTYDPFGNLASVKELIATPGSSALQTRLVQFAYEPVFSQLTKITDARRDSTFDRNRDCPTGCTTTIEHDTFGNPLTIIDHQGNVAGFAYDDRGLLVSATDALGHSTPDIPDDHQTRFTYDAVTGNLLASTDSLGRAASLGYDAAGHVTASTDAAGRSATFIYDALGRLLQVQDAAIGLTRYDYDAADNLIQVTDAKNQATAFAYDALNLLTGTTNSLDQTRQFRYDANRNLAQALDAKGQAITFAYDAANQLVEKVLRDPGGVVQDSVLYGYDALGDLTLVQDLDSRLAFERDSIGRLIKARTGDAANPAFAQPVTQMSYFYDPNGNRQTFSAPAADVQALYTYDGLNRLIDIDERTHADKAFEYDALSRVIRTIGGTRTAFTYDDASQLRVIESTLQGTPFDAFTYAYDLVGNRATLTDRAGLHAYAYDALSRLTGADHPLASGLPDEAFTYDAVGNRLTSHLSATARYDTANRLTEDDTFTYTYDANGNRITRQPKACPAPPAPCPGTQYAYDIENQLIQIDLPDGRSARYRYDGLGRRIEKDVAGTIRRFLYDQEDLLAVFDETGCWQQTIFHGPGIDQPLAFIRDTDANCASTAGTLGFREPLTYLQTDGLGSITSVVAEAGVNSATLRLRERVTYDSFGTPTIRGPGPDQLMDTADDVPLTCSALGNPYLFTGREYDCESGLYYYRARYYDPRTGRFMQPDPVEFADRHFNLYRYVRNNPASFIDPFGLVDLNLFPQEEPIYQNSENTTSPNDTFTVGAHGNVKGPVNAEGDAITPPDLASRIRRDPNYRPGEAVRLDSCEVGYGKFPQELANELGVPVQAPDTYIWIYPNGDVVIAPAQNGDLDNGPDPTSRGQYITFTPQ